MPTRETRTGLLVVKAARDGQKNWWRWSIFEVKTEREPRKTRSESPRYMVRQNTSLFQLQSLTLVLLLDCASDLLCLDCQALPSVPGSPTSLQSSSSLPFPDRDFISENISCWFSALNSTTVPKHQHLKKRLGAVTLRLGAKRS